jgi:hypothetical protein
VNSRFDQHGKCAFLGTHRQYDLWLCEQDGLPPTLVARYGNEPSEYTSYNPAIMIGAKRLSEMREDEVINQLGGSEIALAIRVALDRARAAGFNLL